MLYTATRPTVPATIQEGIQRSIRLAIISVEAMMERGSTRVAALAEIRALSTLGPRSWAAVEEGVKA